MSKDNDQNRESIAIIGIGIRLPKSDSMNGLWQHLIDGDSLISEVPEKRWSKDAYYYNEKAIADVKVNGDRKNKADKTTSIWGGFVDDIDCFDADFFGISPRESKYMDPQQRISLELAWHALEDAGIPANSLSGSSTGVFMGVCHWDYAELMLANRIAIDPYFPTGNAYSIIANRISYFFDFKGPSISVDTACSSSITSIALAVNSIRSGECEVALAGGVNMIWSPYHFIAFSKNGMLSNTGTSYTFDERANGYVRGEGGAILVLKSHTRALADGDEIHAVIRAVGTNHGGKTNSITVTNPKAQAELISNLYQQADIDPRAVGYIEAHGTGTPLGDPIEVHGLKLAFEKLYNISNIDNSAHRCGIGSIKTNMGHLEGAAGIAGIAKVIAAMKYKILPGNINFNKKNPKIDLSDSPFYIVDKNQEWATVTDENGKPLPRIAGISSFGFGGSNSHIVLEEPEVLTPGDGKQYEDFETIDNVIIPLSAKDSNALIRTAEQLLKFIENLNQPSKIDLVRIGYTLQCRRVELNERVAFIVADFGQLKDLLAKFIANKSHSSHIFRGRANAKGEGETLRKILSGNTEFPFAPILEHKQTVEECQKIAGVWSLGVRVAWKKLYQNAGCFPQLTRLPGYPFEKKPFWFPAPDKNTISTTINKQVPAISTSEADLPRVVLSSQDFYLRDHVIDNHLVLPGVFYLELIRQARQQLTKDTFQTRQQNSALQISNVVWQQPFLLPVPIGSENSTRELYFYLNPDQGKSDSSQEFSAFVPADSTTDKAKHFVSGVISTTAQRTVKVSVSEMLNIGDFQEISREKCYQALLSSGINHGPTLRGIDRIYQTHDFVLAQLSVPDAIKNTCNEFVLHPTLLDSALQAGIAVAWLNADIDAEASFVPFSLGSLASYRPCSGKMWTKISGKNNFTIANGTLILNVELYNEGGELCISMESFSMRLLKSSTNTIKNGNHDTLIFEERWIEQPILPGKNNNQQNHLLILGSQSAQNRELFSACRKSINAAIGKLQMPEYSIEGDPEQNYALIFGIFEQVFSYIQNLVVDKPKTTQRIVLWVDRELPTYFYAAVRGLFKTIQIENTRIEARIIRNENSNIEHVIESIQAELFAADRICEVYYLLDGKRQVALPKELNLDQRIALPKETGNTSANVQTELKKVVYWITGGMGGLGRLLASHLIQQKNCTILLTGRSELDSERAQQLQSLQTQGDPNDVTIEYHLVDVNDSKRLQQFVDQLAVQYGGISAIFHCAGVINDNYIIKKQIAECSEVFLPKVSGTLNIDKATSRVVVGNIILFSSMASMFGNPAQSDYSAANAFLDEFARYRNQLQSQGLRFGRTIAINWPLWREGGMSMDENSIDAIEQRIGLVPLPSQVGLDVLWTLIQDETLSQACVTYGRSQPIREFVQSMSGTNNVETGKIPEAQASSTAVKPVETSNADHQSALRQFVVTHLKQILSSIIERDPETIRADQKIEEYGFDSIMAVEMITKLEKGFGSLSKTLFFEYVTIDEVADYLMEEHNSTLTRLYKIDSPPDSVSLPKPQHDENHKNYPVAELKIASPSRKSNTLDRDAYHDIAIVGVAGRYPKSRNMEELWELLSSGQHAFEKIPKDRWNHDAIYFNERDVEGKSTILTGGFIDDIDKFDPRYFQVSQREAEKMSPEVRLFLEVGVEALEDSGYSRETLQQLYQGDIGVIVGTMSNHYNLYGFQNNLVRGAPASGTYTGTIPNMLSYYYGFTGPSLFVDTMCSASSTCIHVAVQMLRNQECKMVVAGGINLLLHPYNLISSSQEHFTTKTSEIIRSYGIGADGTILGEGVGAVVLKPLVEAEKDGDNIWGVIKGTALSNAGIRNGFTVPKPNMQAVAIEKAIEDAGVDPRTISYFEGHGSGTELGDPVEIRGASQAFKKYTDEKQFCPIGSVKSNISHLLAAAGIAGLSKILLQFKHKEIAPSLGAEELNKNIDFEKSPFYVQKNRIVWQQPELNIDGELQCFPRRASITSIGAGGMNSHMILEEYIANNQNKSDILDIAYGKAPEKLFVFSATNLNSLVENIRTLVGYLRKNPEISSRSLAYSLQVAKNQQRCRLAIVAEDISSLTARIAEWLNQPQSQQTSLYYVENTAQSQREFSREEVMRAVHERNLSLVALQWVNGAAIDWFELNPHGSVKKVQLPGYVFEKKRCWYEVFPDAPSVIEPVGNREKLHPLVAKNESTIHGIRFTCDLNHNELLDYVFSYERQPRVISSALLDAALAISKVAKIENQFTIHNVSFNPTESWSDAKTLNYDLGRFENHGQVVYQLKVVAEGIMGSAVTVATFEFRGGRQLSGGIHGKPFLPKQFAVESEIESDSIYSFFNRNRLQFSPYLQAVEKIQKGSGDEWLISIAAPPLQHNHFKKNTLFPAYLLAALKQAGSYIASHYSMPRWEFFDTRGMDSLNLYDNPDQAAYIYFSVSNSHNYLNAWVRVLDAEGRILATFENLLFADDNFTVSDNPTQFNNSNNELTYDKPSESKETARGNGTDKVNEIIVKVVADLLKFDVSEVDEKTTFYEFGFDSIALAKLSTVINQSLDTRISPAVFFDCENIAELGNYIADNFTLNDSMIGVDTDITRSAQGIDHNFNAEGGKDPERISIYEKLNELASDRISQDLPFEPVAVIGMAGRFPKADDVDDFWNNLVDEIDAIGDFPLGRYHAELQGKIKKTNFVKRGGFLANVAGFDAAFFNVSRVEAEYMDPQHRLTLETVWHALENAGHSPLSLPKDTAVFFGVSGNDYRQLLVEEKELDGFMATGTSHAMLVNRLSFMLDIHGPSEPIDTACSSSLVAIHRAIECLQSGQASMVIAGGVNLLLHQQGFAEPQHAGMLSSEGRCKTFSANADGYVRGEGVGAVILKTLKAAETDKDNIIAVIRGSAHQHAGKAKSLTAPNTRSQAGMICRAMRAIDPVSIGYIETHGTGTELGDPVEIDGLKLAFERLWKERYGHTAPHAYCKLGSVKSNIGHLEAAAGIAGFIKILLAIKHKKLPATLHSLPQNPYIDLTNSPFEICRHNQPWENQKSADGGQLPLRAAVSSFGFGGSIAHVVVEEYRMPQTVPQYESKKQAIVLSASTPAQLIRQAIQLRDYLRQHQHALPEIAYTLQTGRAAMSDRLGIIAESHEELQISLTKFIEEERGSNSDHSNIFTGKVTSKNNLPPIDSTDLRTLLSQWVKGAECKWQQLYSNTAPKRIPLPGYPYDRKRFWLPNDHRSDAQSEVFSNKTTSEESDIHEAVFEKLMHKMLSEDIDSNTLLNLLNAEQ